MLKYIVKISLPHLITPDFFLNYSFIFPIDSFVHVSIIDYIFEFDNAAINIIIPEPIIMELIRHGFHIDFFP